MGGFYLDSCSECGLRLSMAGCLLFCLVAPSVGFGFCGCIGLMPFPYVLGEVLFVCCLLLLPFRLGVLLQIVCLAIGLFGNKFLIIQKKKTSIDSNEIKLSR